MKALGEDKLGDPNLEIRAEFTDPSAQLSSQIRAAPVGTLVKERKFDANETLSLRIGLQVKLYKHLGLEFLLQQLR